MRFKSADECVCGSCQGRESVAEGTYGGWVCECPCHQMHPEAIDAIVREHDAEVASWPEGARRAVSGFSHLNTNLFSRWLRLQTRCQKAAALLDAGKPDEARRLLKEALTP